MVVPERLTPATSTSFGTIVFMQPLKENRSEPAPGEFAVPERRSGSERLIVVGPTPPPIHGVMVATKMLIEALRELGLLAAHLETRDPRPLRNLVRLDTRNVLYGLK